MSDITAQRALVHHVLTNAWKFEWSMQGLGMLRLHLSDNFRVHVWDTRFAFPGASPIHDHQQWGLSSLVLSGRMINTRFVEAKGEPTHLFATIKAGYGCYFKHDPKPIRLVECADEMYPAGQRYSQTPKEIHWSRPQNGTVTIMQKTPSEDGESARVFWPIGEEWGSAEPRAAKPMEVSMITENALALWMRP